MDPRDSSLFILPMLHPSGGLSLGCRIGFYHRKRLTCRDEEKQRRMEHRHPKNGDTGGNHGRVLLPQCLRLLSYKLMSISCGFASFKIQQSQKNASLRYFAQPLSPWPALLTLMSSNSQHLEPHCQAIWHAAPWA